MGLRKEYDDDRNFSDYHFDEDPEALNHKRHVRRMLEDKLEQKRLKEELEDDFSDEFSLDEVGRK